MSLSAPWTTRSRIAGIERTRTLLPPSFGISFFRARMGRYVFETSSSRICSRKLSTPLSSMASNVMQSGDGYTVQRHMSDDRPPYSTEELSRIKVPALFVWCTQDRLTPLQWGKDFASAVPGAKLAVIDGCGHLPNLEKPDEFNRAILEFLHTRPTGNKAH